MEYRPEISVAVIELPEADREFKYVLTDRVLSGNGYLHAASTPEKLAMMGWAPGEVRSEVVVVNESGLLTTLSPNRDHDGFGAIAGCGMPHRDPRLRKRYNDHIADTDASAEVIRRSQDTFKELHPEDPRAIVHVDYEEQFRQVARALGMTPRKISKGLF